jgi:hypothetical protein
MTIAAYPSSHSALPPSVGGLGSPEMSPVTPFLSPPAEAQLQRVRERYLGLGNALVPGGLATLELPIDYLFGQERFLGEYYCYWLGPTLGIHNSDLLAELTIATVFARAHAVLNDAMADAPRPPEPARIFASSLFLADALRRFAAIVPDQVAFWRHASRLLRLGSHLDRMERELHWNRLAEFHASDMKLLARKTSICFLPAVVLCLRAGVRQQLPLLFRAIEARNAAIQIRDDLCDWRDDFAAHNYTLPITLAMASFSAFPAAGTAAPEAMPPERVADGLYGTGLVEALLRLSDLYLAAGSRAARTLGSPALQDYFTRLRTGTAALVSACSTINIQDTKLNSPARLLLRTVGIRWPTLALTTRAPLRRCSFEECEAWDGFVSRCGPASGVT